METDAHPETVSDTSGANLETVPDGAQRRSASSTGVLRGKRWWPATFCCGLYVLLTFLEFGLSKSLGSGQITGVRTPDQVQQIWFLEWARYALAHGHNPFYTQWQNYPVGMNLLGNTSMMALGVLFSPITSLFGPIVTWNVLIRLALVASATSMCLVLRRWTTWWPAAFVGGLLYGFSAYATFYAVGYLFLIFVPLPPLIFLLLHEIMVRQRWRPVRTGVLLGAACVVQYFISAEVLTSTILLGAVACVAYVFVRRREMAAKRAYIMKALSRTVIVGAVVLAYPVLFALFGTAHVHGAPRLAGGPGDLWGLFVPGFYQWVDPSSTKNIWNQFEPYFYSASLYLGIPFVLILVATVIWLRRRPFVVFAGAMAAVAMILSMGSPLYVDQHNTHVPLPFTLLAHIPIVDGLIATRFSLFTYLFGASALAAGLDELYLRVRRWRPFRRLAPLWGRVVAGGAGFAVAAIVVIPLVPKHSQPTSPTQVPALFTSRSLTSIPSGSVVLTYPYPSALVHTLRGAPSIYYPFVNSVDEALLDQAVSGMDFKLVGGYGWTPSRTTERTAHPSPLTPSSVETLFNVSFYGVATPAQHRLLARSNLTADLRQFMRKYHIDSVITLPLGQRRSTVISNLTAALGPPSLSDSDGVISWFGVQDRLSGLSARALGR